MEDEQQVNSHLSGISQQLFTNCSLAVQPMFVAETLAFIIGVSVAFAFAFIYWWVGCGAATNFFHRFFHRLWITCG
jgi:hypothetical protein